MKKDGLLTAFPRCETLPPSGSGQSHQQVTEYPPKKNTIDDVANGPAHGNDPPEPPGKPVVEITVPNGPGQPHQSHHGTQGQHYKNLKYCHGLPYRA